MSQGWRERAAGTHADFQFQHAAISKARGQAQQMFSKDGINAYENSYSV